MKKETIYYDNDLTDGICNSCSEESYEILESDGRCVDCIESEKFYDETMKGL